MRMLCTAPYEHIGSFCVLSLNRRPGNMGMLYVHYNSDYEYQAERPATTLQV